MHAVDVVVAGHLSLDMLPEMEHVSLDSLGTPGRLYETGRLALATGGAVANTGVALHKLGIQVALMANVGDDFVGQAILSILERHDLTLTRCIKVLAGESSAYTIVLSPEHDDRIFLSGVQVNNSFGMETIDFSILKNAQVFHLGYPTLLPRLYADKGDELVAVFQQAKAAGVVTSMDMALPDPNRPAGQADWRGILRRTLPYVDIFIPSIEEALFCLRRSDYDDWKGRIYSQLSADYLSELANELIAMGSVMVGFKLGEMGIYLKTADEAAFGRLARLALDVSAWANVTLWSAALQVDVVGTTGAGDAAYAGLLASLLRGLKPDEALRFACAVGACNVEAADATSGLRTWAETQARLDAGWPSRPERLAGHENQ